ncbi:Conserved protein of unknown function [Mycobacterium canettii CIPT 140070017]|nr:Conserved protein of unknown function [Mycobacterium canettii CIPT 140070010]CCK63172.1 Conserved protein of unknown function [Mycobacterium canettii CIPT 140070017]
MGADTVAGVPSHLHEMLVELFTHRPVLAVELLADAHGVRLPEFVSARTEPGELTDTAPTEYRADRVIVLSGTAAPVGAIVLEVQLARDDDKRWSWPVYVATLRARLRCPVTLLVICPDPRVAEWCAAAIDLGDGNRLAPRVLGPDRIPTVTDPVQAVAIPELAVLSAIAHGADPDPVDVLVALQAGLVAMDDVALALRYHDVVLAALPEAARHTLEELMTTGTDYEWQSEFYRKRATLGRAEGRAEGEANAVLAVLDARGIEISEPVRARVTGCTDLDQLDTWIRRAATATTVDDLFD